MNPDELHADFYKDKPEGYHPDGKPSRETLERINNLEKSVVEKMIAMEKASDIRIDSLEKTINLKIEGIVKEWFSKFEGLSKEWGSKVDNMAKLFDEKMGKKVDISWFILGITMLVSLQSGMFYLVLDRVEGSRSELKGDLEKVGADVGQINKTVSKLEGRMESTNDQLSGLELIDIEDIPKE